MRSHAAQVAALSQIKEEVRHGTQRLEKKQRYSFYFHIEEEEKEERSLQNTAEKLNFVVAVRAPGLLCLCVYRSDKDTFFYKGLARKE